MFKICETFLKFTSKYFSYLFFHNIVTYAQFSYSFEFSTKLYQKNLENIEKILNSRIYKKLAKTLTFNAIMYAKNYFVNIQVIKNIILNFLKY